MDRLEEKKQIAVLMDIYGGLLTDRQREFLDLHYNEDLSYGEIAEAQNISRQAVHDAIQHGKKGLFHFEDHLKLAEKVAAESIQADDQGHDLEDLKAEVKRLSRLVQDDPIYDMAPVKRSVTRLKELLEI